MSKIIAVWGSPNSGKTAFSVKLAEHICKRLGVVVSVVFADMTAPSLPVLFPNRKADDMLSIGAVLSKPEITQHELLKNTVTVKGKSNLGFLGFTDGENRFSYPAFDSQKAEALFTILKGIDDVIVVDCTSDIQNILTVSAMKLADTIIRVANPDLKSVSYFSSQLPLMGDLKYRRDEHIICLNENEQAVFLPVNEAISHFGEVAFLLPFCPVLKKQFVDGALLENLTDKKFTAVLNALVGKAVRYAED